MHCRMEGWEIERLSFCCITHRNRDIYIATSPENHFQNTLKNGTLTGLVPVSGLGPVRIRDPKFATAHHVWFRTKLWTSLEEYEKATKRISLFLSRLGVARVSWMIFIGLRISPETGPDMIQVIQVTDSELSQAPDLLMCHPGDWMSFLLQGKPYQWKYIYPRTGEEYCTSFIRVPFIRQIYWAIQCKPAFSLSLYSTLHHSITPQLQSSSSYF